MNNSNRAAKILQRSVYNRKETDAADTNDVNHLLTTAMTGNREEIGTLCVHDEAQEGSEACLRSISPPPYSPLTPLMLRPKAKAATKENAVQLNSSTSRFLQPHSPSPALSTLGSDEPVSSPVPAMSPESQKIFDVLCDATNIDTMSSPDILQGLENDNFFYHNHCNTKLSVNSDDDDSVKDPDFLISDEGESSESQIENSESEEEIVKLKIENSKKNEKNGRKQETLNKEITTKTKTLNAARKNFNEDERTSSLIETENEGLNKNRRTTNTGLKNYIPDKSLNHKLKIDKTSSSELISGIYIGKGQEKVIIATKDQTSRDMTKLQKEADDAMAQINIGSNETIFDTSMDKTELDAIPVPPVYENQDGIPNSSNEIDEINRELDQESEKNKKEGRPKKGRKRKHPEYTQAERKQRKYDNLPFQGRSKLVKAKVFEDYSCSCKRLCFLSVSKEIRQREFETYVALGSYEAQLLYIIHCVKESQKKRCYSVCQNSSGKKKPREYSRNYFIDEKPVCRDMFIRTFQITPQKVTISLKKYRESHIKDRRGKQIGGWNKTSPEATDLVCKVINALPKYESHYRRSNNGDALYLGPEMSIGKIYELYEEAHEQEYGDAHKKVSFATLKRIFHSKFNLRFKKLKKDTCNKCDTIAAKLKCGNMNDEEKQSLSLEKDQHLKSAESLRAQMNQDIETAKTDSLTECITFDMEKTLPLPRIPTNIIFYKRQLWFYNCGIHAGSNNKGYCYVWLEGEAGRGAQEVGSCLIKFINTKMKPTTRHLILWSDSCGGQNRNIKVVLLLKAVLASHPTLETITLKFLESGHSFLPNDTDFGKIEAHLKKFERLYTARDYMNVISNCTKKNKLEVSRMQKEDFVGTKLLEKNIVNRKVFTDKTKVNWLKTKQILIKKDNLYAIFMKKKEEDPFDEINIEKKYRGKSFPVSKDLLQILWPNGKPINQAKLDDLKSLFHLIPQDCQSFYKELTGSSDVVDDIDGFGQEDFDVDNNDDSDD